VAFAYVLDARGEIMSSLLVASGENDSVTYTKRKRNEMQMKKKNHKKE
jgi:hypothetical protein